MLVRAGPAVRVEAILHAPVYNGRIGGRPGKKIPAAMGRIRRGPIRVATDERLTTRCETALSLFLPNTPIGGEKTLFGRQSVPLAAPPSPRDQTYSAAAVRIPFCPAGRSTGAISSTYYDDPPGRIFSGGGNGFCRAWVADPGGVVRGVRHGGAAYAVRFWDYVSGHRRASVLAQIAAAMI